MRTRVLMLVAVLLLLLPGLVSGQVVLKPKGGAAMPLRVKVLEAKVSIDRMLASTQLNLAFQNETADRIEADFYYTLPPDTQVSYFAYWYGDEKVVARVVEKERAAAIYKHITTRMRDPALIEMVGKNTFRARIFPIMPNADLKVEMRLVERLKTDSQGALYQLPLKLAKGETLDRLDVDIRVTPDGSFTKVSNNLGLPQEAVSEGARIALAGTNYRPQRDLVVRLAREPKGLRAVLYSARSGGSDGFFALSLTPSRAIRNAKTLIRGLRTYDVVGAGARSVRAHGTLLVTGRYADFGRAAVDVSGVVDGRKVRYALPITFSDDAVPNNPAAKLWAAARIASLSGSRSNRAAVMALSQRHTLPSKFTSWLAIPVEERERYKYEKAMAEASVLSAQIAHEISKRVTNDGLVYRLYSDLDHVFREAKVDRNLYMQNLFSEHTYAKAREIARKYPSPRSNYRRGHAWRALVRLCRLTKQDPAREVEGARSQVDNDRYNAAHNELSRLTPALSEEILAGRAEGSKARRLRSRVEALCRQVRISPAEQIRSYTQQSVGTAAWELAAEERKSQPDGAKLSQLCDRLSLLSRRAGTDRQAMLSQARHGVRHGEINLAGQQLVRELAEGRFESEAARAARQSLDRLAAETGATQEELASESRHNGLYSTSEAFAHEVAEGRAGSEAARTALERYRRICRETGTDDRDELRSRLRTRILQSAYELVHLRHQPRPDRARLAAMEARAERLARAGEFDLVQLLDPFERPYRTNAALRLRDQIIAEYRKETPDTEAARTLERRFVEVTSSPDSAWTREWSMTRLQRLAAEAELDRLLSAQASPERTARISELETRLAPLRARMGDPLISVDAPADAKQVVALMPDGEIKQLAYDAAKKRWEARFDIPTYAREGEYAVTVIVVRADGTRQTLAFTFHVDVTPPSGRASAVRSERAVLRLEIECSADTARVEAILPSGELVSLKRSPSTGRYFALAQRGGGTTRVTFILTDRAHNRAAIEVDLRDCETEGGAK